ncbi:MAG: hypothetical protein QOK45_2917 [Mycobacterium sp.]|jgi:hypothetical protein|nr:hypothetical protein [Mycobacterium sp.]
MHKLVSTIVFSLSALDILFAGVTIDYSEVSILGCQKGDAWGAGNDGVRVCPVFAPSCYCTDCWSPGCGGTSPRKPAP